MLTLLYLFLLLLLPPLTFATHARLEFNPTSIWTTHIPATALNTTQLSQVLLDLRRQQPLGTRNQRSTRGGWRYNLDDVDRNNPPLFLALIQTVKQFYKTAVQELGWDPRIMLSDDTIHMKSWGNIHDRGGYNVRHNHPNCHLSGIFYAQTPPGAGLLRLYSPQRFPDSMDDVTPEHVVQIPLAMGGNRLSSNAIDVTPEPGLLVLFPSYLVHEVVASTADSARISFAFNIVPLFEDVGVAFDAPNRGSGSGSGSGVVGGETKGTCANASTQTTLAFSRTSRVDMRAWAMGPKKVRH